MKVTVRRSDERGLGSHGWLESRHTFSFASYFDPQHAGFRTLRVINEDRVAPGRGFGTHPHNDMEIFSYVVDGLLSHRDSEGHEAAIGPGQVQFMSAGSGIKHSEFNGSKKDPAHFLQVWIKPAARGLAPRYEDGDFREALAAGRPVLLLSPDGGEGSIRIGQDARVWGARLPAGAVWATSLAVGRGAWLQVIRGSARLNAESLGAGDGASTDGPGEITITAGSDGAEFLFFDLA